MIPSRPIVIKQDSSACKDRNGGTKEKFSDIAIFEGNFVEVQRTIGLIFFRGPKNY